MSAAINFIRLSQQLESLLEVAREEGHDCETVVEVKDSLVNARDLALLIEGDTLEVRLVNAFFDSLEEIREEQESNK